MHRVLIPVWNKKMSDRQRQLIAEQVKKARADEILLTFPRVLRNPIALEEQIALFTENKQALEGMGICVNAWLAPTMGYGGTGVKFEFDHDADETYTRIKHLNGKLLYSYCPLDNAFTDDFIRTVKAICSTGVRFILFEDDFTISGGKSYDF